MWFSCGGGTQRDRRLSQHREKCDGAVLQMPDPTSSEKPSSSGDIQRARLVIGRQVLKKAVGKSILSRDNTYGIFHSSAQLISQ
jgi:hypothetical protein